MNESLSVQDLNLEAIKANCSEYLINFAKIEAALKSKDIEENLSILKAKTSHWNSINDAFENAKLMNSKFAYESALDLLRLADGATIEFIVNLLGYLDMPHSHRFQVNALQELAYTKLAFLLNHSA